MSRAAVPGLPSRYPIGDLLPALYADDDLARRFTAGLDTVLAPVFCTLDNLPSYFDPLLAPADFLAWLAEWVGLEAGPGRPEEPRRAAVAGAVALHRWRGTRRGLVERLRLSCGAGAEVVDGGGVVRSATPRTPLPPAPSGELLVRYWPLPGPDGRPGAAVDEERVRAVVASCCPVHLGYRLEPLPGPPPDDGPPPVASEASGARPPGGGPDPAGADPGTDASTDANQGTEED